MFIICIFALGPAGVFAPGTRITGPIIIWLLARLDVAPISTLPLGLEIINVVLLELFAEDEGITMTAEFVVLPPIEIELLEAP